jgi:ComF family protein
VAIHELKYRGRRRVAGRLVEKLLEQGSARALLEGCDLVVPVPLHPRRLRERGYNQASLLAQELGRRTGRPCGEGALVRRKDTTPQYGLSAAARRRNVAGAFAVRRRGLIAGRVVTLVDDVFTTGATSYACARALKEAGAREVRLLSLARVL